jgi:hypothetical protein
MRSDKSDAGAATIAIPRRALVGAILDGYQKILRQVDPISARFPTVTSSLEGYLDRLHRADAENGDQFVTETQVRIAQMLVAAAPNWEMLHAASPQQFYGEPPISIVSKNWAMLYVEARTQIKRFAQEMLEAETTYRDIPKSNRDTIEKALKELVAMQ